MCIINMASSSVDLELYFDILDHSYFKNSLKSRELLNKEINLYSCCII